MAGDKFRSIETLQKNRFLNFYHMDALTDTGRAFDYYFVSRNPPEKIKARTGENRAEGVVICSLLKSDPERIVLIRQYRYPLGDWIWELPAGLIDPGETPEQAAVRELREETGYRLEPVSGDEAWSRPFYMGAGFTDEACCALFGYASEDGEKGRPEETESIRVLTADRKELRHILRTERVSLRMAYLCMNILNSDPGEPFAFLGRGGE
ncbi:MAG: NUDIX hydrolase [Lachnospiraceae bacterium]|nr:NUDIX hydrolase [Lachnospiraceae bacterium]